MSIDGILAPADVVHGLRASSKKALLKELARLSSLTLGLCPDDVLGALVRREELGSTGVGDGVALPHARLDTVRQPFGLLAHLRDPLDFDAIDERPVDLVFLLLLPSANGGEHPNVLASVARWLRDAETAAALRGARDAASLYALVSGRSLGKV